MAAPVPAVERVKLVLDVLASDPRRSYRAAEVARLTGIHRASCFALLGSLTDAGLVSRDPVGPSYALGPTLISYGTQAAARFGPLAQPRRAMFELAHDLACGAILTGRMGYELVTLDSVGVEDEPLAGAREPLRAPRGTVFLAWSTRSELDDWIAWSAVSESEQRAVVRTAAAIHARGYSLGADVELGMSLERLARQLSGGTDSRPVDDVLYDLAKYVHRSTRSSKDGLATAGDAVHRISAPIFDRMGKVATALTLVAVGASFGDDVPRIAKRLLDSTYQLSDGRPAN